MGSATCPLSGVTVTFTGAGDKGARRGEPSQQLAGHGFLAVRKGRRPIGVLSSIFSKGHL